MLVDFIIRFLSYRRKQSTHLLQDVIDLFVYAEGKQIRVRITLYSETVKCIVRNTYRCSEAVRIREMASVLSHLDTVPAEEILVRMHEGEKLGNERMNSTLRILS